MVGSAIIFARSKVDDEQSITGDGPPIVNGHPGSGSGKSEHVFFIMFMFKVVIFILLL